MVKKAIVESRVESIGAVVGDLLMNYMGLRPKSWERLGAHALGQMTRDFFVARQEGDRVWVVKPILDIVLDCWPDAPWAGRPETFPLFLWRTVGILAWMHGVLTSRTTQPGSGGT